MTNVVRNPTNIRAVYGGRNREAMRLVDPASGVEALAPGYTARAMTCFEGTVCQFCPAHKATATKPCPGPDATGHVSDDIYRKIGPNVVQDGLCN